MSSSTFALARPKVPSCGLVREGINVDGGGEMYSLLCELTGTLVLGVTEEFDDTTLVWCESAQNNH